MEEIKIINNEKDFFIKINYLSNKFFVINNEYKNGNFEIIENTLILIWENDDIEYYKKKSNNVYSNNSSFDEYYFVNNNNLTTKYYIDDIFNIYDNKSSNKIIGKKINDNQCKINNNIYIFYEDKFYEKSLYTKIIIFEYNLIFIDNYNKIINKNFNFNKTTNEVIENSAFSEKIKENKLKGIYLIKDSLLVVKFSNYENNFILTSDKILYSNELLNKYYEQITINFNNILSLFIYDKKNNIVFDKYDTSKKYLVIDNRKNLILKIDDELKHFSYDKILDCYNIVDSNNEIYIIHNSWNDTLILNNDNNTLKRKSIEDETGKFEYINNKIIIYWDKWNKEVFIKNNENNYTLCANEKTEYIEIFHKNWNDKCILKDNTITRIIANNESGTFSINDNIINIKWDNWDCENFYIFNNKYYYEKIIKIGNINNTKYYFNTLNNFIYNTELNEIGNFNIIDTNKIYINLENNKKEYNYKEIDNNIVFIEEINIELVKYKFEEPYIIYTNNNNTNNNIKLDYNIFSKNDKNIYGKYKLNGLILEIKWVYGKKEIYKKNNDKYYLTTEKQYKFIDFDKIYYFNINDKSFCDDNDVKYDFLYNNGSYYIIINNVMLEFISYNINDLIYVSKKFYNYIVKENFNKKLYNNLYYDNKYFNNINNDQNKYNENDYEDDILNEDLDKKILLDWYNNKNINNIYSINNFNKIYDFFDIQNFKKRNSIKINDENIIMNWIIKYRFSNLFYNNYDIDIIKSNIYEINSYQYNNNYLFLTCIIENKLDIDILDNIIFKKKNIVVFIIIQFKNDIMLKELVDYVKNNINNIYFIIKTKNINHYFIINEVSKIINKYLIKNDYLDNNNDDNISINTDESIIINNNFIYIKNISLINEELCINNIYLNNINIKIDNDINNNGDEKTITFKEIDNYFIKLLYNIDNILDLIKLLIIYYLVFRKNINNLGNVFYLNYLYMLEIFNFYNENIIIVRY